MASASEDRFHQSWKLQELSGKPAQAWLIVRRTVATLLAIGLLILCGWMIFRLFWVPNSYLAYWSASAYQPLGAGPVRFAYDDYKAIDLLKDNSNFAGSKLLDPAEKPLTKELLEENLRALADLGMRGKDACIVFLTAHGRVRDKEAFLLCESNDGKSELPAIPVPEILASLKNVPAGTKLLVLDAGRDELATENSASDDTFPSLLQKAVKDAEDPSIWVLTANAPFERSHVSPKDGRSVFGYMVSQGLRGEADLDGNGTIELGELYKYVQGAVAAWAKTATGAGETQTPQLYHFNANNESSERVPELRLVKASKQAAEPEPAAKHSAEEDAEAESGGIRKWAAERFSEAKERLTGSVKEDVHIFKEMLGVHEHEGHGAEGEGHEAHGGGATAEHGDTEHKDASHQAKAEPKIDSIADARKQVADAWQKAAALESSTSGPSPGVTAPWLWRELLNRLLWCDRFCASGIPLEAKDSWKQVAKQLGRVDLSLQDFAADRLPTRATAPAGREISFAMAERLAASGPDESIPKQLTDFVQAYDLLLSQESPDTFKDKLNGLLKAQEKFDLGLAKYYEFQLLGPNKESQSLNLNNDPEVSSATLRQVLFTRRVGEKFASDPLCGQGWLHAEIEAADRLRSEGERELLDRTSNGWEKVATDRLTAAIEAYKLAYRNLESIRGIIQDRNTTLLRAPDLVHRAFLNGGDPQEIAAVKKVFAAVHQLNNGLAEPTNTNIAAVEQLYQQLQEARGELKRKTDPADNAWRMTNLLATALPSPDDRGKLRSESAAAGQKQIADIKVPESEADAVTASTPSDEQWKRIVNEFSLQIELARLAGCDEKELDKLKLLPTVAESDRVEKLNEARDQLAKLFANVPDAITNVVKGSGPGSPAKPDQLRKALPHWILLGPQQRNQIDPKNDLISRLDRASWHDLLAWNSDRHHRATDDAPANVEPFLSKASATFHDMANAMPDSPAVPQFDLPILSISLPQEVSLVASDNGTIGFTVTSTASEEKPIWLTAQYNDKWLEIDGKVYRQHELPEVVATKNLGEKASRYPLRPDALGLPAIDQLPARGSRDYTVKIKRQPNRAAGGVTKLIVKAVSGTTFVRREMDVVLPGRASLDVAVRSPGEPGIQPTDALQPLPNRVEAFAFDVKGDKVEKDVKVSIWAPTVVTNEEELAAIPSGAMNKDVADQLLAPFGLLQLGPEFPIKLPASGMPVRVKLGADDSKGKPPANLLLKDKADPATFPGIPLNYGLVIQLADEKTKQVSVRRIEITPQRPHGYLEAVAHYDRATELFDITVKATKPAVIPADGLRISARVSGASDQGESSLAGTLKGPSYEVKLFTELVRTGSQEVTAYVDVDDYPRAFVFKFSREKATRPDIAIRPASDVKEVRIVGPEPGKSYPPDKGITIVKVKAEVDAPTGAFENKDRTSKVELGIDQRRQRTLDVGDPIAIRRSDRQVVVTAKSLSPDGLLELDTRVRDFEIDLQTGLTNKKVYLLGHLEIDGKIYWSDLVHPVEVILDGAPPAVHADFPPQKAILPSQDPREDPKVISGEDLLVHVFMYPEDEKSELSGVQKVQAAFALEATKDSKPAKPEIGVPDGKGGWIVKLSTKDEKLGLGKHSVRITATDKVENESKPLQVPVVIVTKPEKTAPAPTNVNTPKTPDLANDVSGKVQFGDEGVKSKVELIAVAGAPIKPTETDASGSFKFTKVPPGKYTLKANTTEALQNYRRKAEKEIEVPPKPKVFAPINVKVK